MQNRERHAYLLLCHNHLSQLLKLLELLDDPVNDIFIHIDKKSRELQQNRLLAAVQQAGIFFVSPVPVFWGGYSMIRAELRLLRAARKEGPYAYYHLISGADLPLKSQREIHDFFREKAGKEFITFDTVGKEQGNFYDRVRYYYWLQDRIGRSGSVLANLLRLLDSKLLHLQKRLSVDRLKGKEEAFYKGDSWFSITDDLARYVLEQKPFIRRHFRFSLCADEIFLQTIVMNSLFRDRVEPLSTRFIDWDRGNPYVFKTADYEQLAASPKLFARKFDETKDNEIILRIGRMVKERTGQ